MKHRSLLAPAPASLASAPACLTSALAVFISALALLAPNARAASPAPASAGPGPGPSSPPARPSESPTASGGAAAANRTPTLHSARRSPSDLEIQGLTAGPAVPGAPTSAVYASWADLRALPTVQLRLSGEFVPGEQTVTALFLADLLKALPPAPGADCILARCADGYAAVYPSGFVSRYKPFLVLEINGKGPAAWPPPGLNFNPAPYVITVSERLVPEVARFPDIEHKKPWGVTSIALVQYAKAYAAAYSGRWALLSKGAQAGREIWIHSCASCHAGPGGIPGGTKSGIPFEAVAGFAVGDPGFFMRYVRDPKSVIPGARMEAHPHYTDAELAQLIAFVAAGSSRL